MDKSDIEMEDTENHPHDSRSYFTPAIAVAEDAEGSENGGEDPCECDTATSIMDGGEDTGISIDDSKDNKILTGLLEGQSSPNIEAAENVNAVNNCGEDRELTDQSLAIAVEQKAMENVDVGNNSSDQNKQLLTKSSSNEAPLSQNCNVGEQMEDIANVNQGKEVKDALKEQSKEVAVTDGNTDKTIFTQAMLSPMVEDDDGTPEEQATFIKELESFHQEREMNFNPQEVNEKPLNFLKLWRCVIRLGGYDRVTGYKLWCQVGELFFPSKTCVTICWACQILYEKYVLEYERHKTQSGELQLPEVILPREPETSKQKPTVPVVVNVGPSADWVTINVRETTNFYKVYGLVPGLSPEEIRVQSDPAGRLVISGRPKRRRERWGVAPFQKIVVFPARINPSKTFAFVSLYGRLWIRAPFEQSNKSS